MSECKWLVELHALAARYGARGFTADLGALTLTEAWGLFVFLHQLAEAERA